VAALNKLFVAGVNTDKLQAFPASPEQLPQIEVTELEKRRKIVVAA